MWLRDEDECFLVADCQNWSVTQKTCAVLVSLSHANQPVGALHPSNDLYKALCCLKFLKNFLSSHADTLSRLLEVDGAYRKTSIKQLIENNVIIYLVVCSLLPKSLANEIIFGMVHTAEANNCVLVCTVVSPATSLTDEELWMCYSHTAFRAKVMQPLGGDPNTLQSSQTEP